MISLNPRTLPLDMLEFGAPMKSIGSLEERPWL